MRSFAAMFGGSLKSADLGAQLAEETTDAMDAVVQKAGEVRERVNDIASATKEQERGIVQIDTAVREMGGVTEENAANAEESASAAEELSSHSLSLRAVVTELEELISGRSHGAQTHSGGTRGGGRGPKQGQVEQAAHDVDLAPSLAGRSSRRDKAGGVTSAERIIPLDERELASF
ncbi:MAG: hypothetical protein CMJ87_08905 [Planctomycetes bacterium]|nr:hypothetical protein [Planctomycetota bacterium]